MPDGGIELGKLTGGKKFFPNVLRQHLHHDDIYYPQKHSEIGEKRFYLP